MTQETRSTCPYCGVGCGVIIESDGGQITGVRGDPQHPANFGRLCTKGSTLHLTAAQPVTLQTRLLQPQMRAERGGVPQPVSWDLALDHLADRFASVITTHAGDLPAVALDDHAAAHPAVRAGGARFLGHGLCGACTSKVWSPSAPVEAPGPARGG